MGKLFKILLALVVVAGLAGGVYAVATSGKKADGGIKLVEADVGSITEKALAVGQIQPRQKYSVKSKISGLVKVCRVQVGTGSRPVTPSSSCSPTRPPSR